MSSHAAAGRKKGGSGVIKGKVTVAGPSLQGEKRKRPAVGRGRAALNENDDEEEMSDDSDEEEGEEEEEELGTDEEIAAAQAGKSKKTSKRKRRATSPSTFGLTLEELLGGGRKEQRDGEEAEEEERETVRQATSSAGQPAILSLAPHIRRGAQSSRLNAKAARLALTARRKREDRAHVRDVIGGWGAPGERPKTEEGEEKPASKGEGEVEEAEQLKQWLQEGGAQGYEKRLRKAAQRGVVKLFNAIRAAQNTSVDDLKDEDGPSKKAKSAPIAAASKKGFKEDRTPSQGKKAENPLGGKTKAVNELSKNNFFDLLRAGTKSKV